MKNNNLFVLHTQYNLILATGLIHDKFKDANNILVLHAEFKVSEEFISIMNTIFDSIVIIQNDFQKRKSRLKQDIYTYKKYKRYLKNRKIRRLCFDRIFLTQEDEIDIMILKEHIKNTPEIIYIEDGVDAYFSNNPKLNSLTTKEYFSEIDRIKTNHTFIQKLYYKTKSFIFRIEGIYHPVYCYGMNRVYNSAILLFPNLVRAEIKHLKRNEISNESLSKGINSIYSNKGKTLVETKKVLVLFFDLIDRMPSNMNFELFLEELEKWSDVQDVKILFKYHPRETNTYNTVKNRSVFIEIDQHIPSEKIIYDLQNTSSIVIGNLSTSIMISRKMNCETICTSKILGIKNEKAFQFLKEIGVHIPLTLSELIEIIRNI